MDENKVAGAIVDVVQFLLLLAVVAWTLFGAAIVSAPFLGETPDRRDLLTSAGVLFGGAAPGESGGALLEGVRAGVLQLPGLILVVVAVAALVLGVRERRGRGAPRPSRRPAAPPR